MSGNYTDLNIVNNLGNRELDALIAVKVMGLDTAHLDPVWIEESTEDGNDGWDGFVCPKCKASYNEKKRGYEGLCCKPYSTNISDAWKVHQEITGTLLFSRRIKYYEELQKIVSYRVSPGREYLINYPDIFTHLWAEDICRAALLTIDGE